MNNRRVPVLAAILIATVPAGCGHGSAATPATPAAASEPVGHRYQTKSFGVALTVTVDDMLKSPPTADSHTLLSWDSARNPEQKIRFFIPAEVYAPGSSKPIPPPDDYPGYVTGLAKSGAVFTDTTTVTVGGRTAAESTATSTEPAGSLGGYWDGTLGCPSPESTNTDDCFGIQPDYLLRLAIVDVGGTPVLAWARVLRTAPDPAFFAMFETMLASVSFR